MRVRHERTRAIVLAALTTGNTSSLCRREAHSLTSRCDACRCVEGSGRLVSMRSVEEWMM